MSASPPIDELAQILSSATADSRIHFAVLALISCEYLFTLDREISLFWMRKKTGATWLFLATRYLALLAYPLLGGATFSAMSNSSCAMVVKAQAYEQVSQYLCWAIFPSLRVLALGHMNWLLACGVFILACGPFAVNMWALRSLGASGENIPLLGCTAYTNSGTPHESLIATAVSRSCAIAAEVLVLVVTLQYMVKTGVLGKARGTLPPGKLARALIVHGVFYFLALATLNLVHIILTLVSVVFVLESTSYVTSFTDPLSAVLICRFLMDLQYANQEALDPGFDESRAEASSLWFASRVIGSISGSIAADPDMVSLDGEGGEEYDIVEPPPQQAWAPALDTHVSA